VQAAAAVAAVQGEVRRAAAGGLCPLLISPQRQADAAQREAHGEYLPTGRSRQIGAFATELGDECGELRQVQHAVVVGVVPGRCRGDVGEIDGRNRGDVVVIGVVPPEEVLRVGLSQVEPRRLRGDIAEI